MRWEVRKLLGSRFLVLLALALLAVNALLFYQHAGQGDLAQIQVLYDRRGELEPLRDDLLERALAGEDPYDDSLLTGDIYQELSLVEAALDRITPVERFPEIMADLRGQAQAQFQSGLFGGPDSFEGRSLRLTDGVYAVVEQVKPEVDFFGGVEVLLDWRVADAFAALLALACALTLFAQERERGTLALLRPTRYGRATLFGRKLLALLAGALVPALALYGSCLAIAGGLYGLGDLSLPVQSVYGLTTCPYLLSVGGFLVLFLGMKLLWLLALTALFALAANALRSAPALVALAALFALSLGLQALPSNLARCLNLLAAGDTLRLFDGLLFLNFFGWPVVRLHAVIALCALLGVGSFAGSLALFVGRDGGAAAHSPSLGIPLGRHVRPMAHEWRKLLRSNGGLAVLALLISVQAVTYQGYAGSYQPEEIFYRQYSQVLSGPPGPEKEDYLAQEGARLDQLQEEYATVLSAAQQSSGLMVYAESLAAQLRAQRPFDQARAQYNALLPGQSYVYTTPYERLYDAGGMAADRVDLAKLLLALALVLPFFFCMEGETGVIALIRAAGAEGAVRRRKRAAAWLFALGCALAAFLPRMLAVAAALGLPELTARANSLPRFAGLPDILPLWGVLALSMAARAGLAVAGAAAVEWISARARAPIPAVLASLLLPGLALLSAGLG